MLDRNGIETALEQVRPRVFKLCNRVLRHAEDAEDATQHVLLKVADRLRRTPDDPPLDGWLYQVTLTTSLELRRKGLRRARHEQRKPEAAPILPGEDPVWDGLHLAIAELNEELRSLVVDYYFEKRTLEDLARAGGCSAVAVWKKISKAREEIKGRLRKAGLGAAIPTPAMEWLFGADPMAPAGNSALAVGAMMGGTTMASKTGSLGFTVAASLVFLVVGATAGAVIANRRSSKEEAALRDQLAKATAKLDQASRDAAGRLETAAVVAAAGPSASSAPTAAPAVPAPPATATFRDRLRKLVRQGLMAKEGQRDADAMAELMPTILEIYPVLQGPSKLPEKFVEFYQAWFEVAAEEVGMPFSEAQKGKLGAVLEEVRRSFAENANAAGPERRILELQGKRRLVQGLADLLSPAQVEAMPPELIDDQGVDAENFVYLAKDSVAGEIVQAWTEPYQLQDYQKPAADAAARSLVDAMSRLSERFVAANGYRPDDVSVQKPAEQLRRKLQKLDYRIDLAAAQRDALKTLDAVLSPEQRKLAASKRMPEFYVASTPVLSEEQKR